MSNLHVIHQCPNKMILTSLLIYNNDFYRCLMIMRAYSCSKRYQFSNFFYVSDRFYHTKWKRKLLEYLGCSSSTIINYNKLLQEKGMMISILT